MKQERSRKWTLQPGSQRRERKTSFFIYIGTLVQLRNLENEWRWMNCTYVLQINDLVGDLVRAKSIRNQ